MEVVGNITRFTAGGALGRLSGVGPIAPATRSGNDGARSPRDDSQTTSEKHDKVVQGGHVAAAKIKTAGKIEQPQEQPEAVTIDPIFDRRIGNSRGGIYVDLVYPNTNFRAVRLFGPTGRHEEQGTTGVDATVNAGEAARAYREASAEADPRSSTVLTG